jgi:hypothetical protein
MNDTSNKWTWNDGWILMSAYLVCSNNKPSLADIISAADAINHAIPTPNELSQAFTKLANAGVLEIGNNCYRIKHKYLDEIERTYQSKGGLFESARKGEKWLQASNLNVNKTEKITITGDEVTTAYDEYISKIPQ